MGIFGNLIWVLAIICAVWVIVDVLTKHKKMDQTQKIIWIVCAVVFSIITAIVYYFVVKHK
ncbi:MAG: PLDc N-terminal domain-containing protein [Candidatus Woesearchaeota archaeon]|jgi:prolipoprotein diacylglyceryltransferase